MSCVLVDTASLCSDGPNAAVRRQSMGADERRGPLPFNRLASSLPSFRASTPAAVPATDNDRPTPSLAMPAQELPPIPTRRSGESTQSSDPRVHALLEGWPGTAPTSVPTYGGEGADSTLRTPSNYDGQISYASLDSSARPIRRSASISGANPTSRTISDQHALASQSPRPRQSSLPPVREVPRYRTHRSASSDLVASFGRLRSPGLAPSSGPSRTRTRATEMTGLDLLGSVAASVGGGSGGPSASGSKPVPICDLCGKVRLRCLARR